MFGSCCSISSSLTNQWPWFRSSQQRYSIKKGVLKNLTKVIGKHLCQSLFFNKVIGFSSIFKNTFFTENFGATASLDSPKSVSLYCNHCVSLRIQSECEKIRTRNYSVFGHFSRSEWIVLLWPYVKFCRVSDISVMFITY